MVPIPCGMLWWWAPHESSGFSKTKRFWGGLSGILCGDLDPEARAAEEPARTGHKEAPVQKRLKRHP